MYKPTKAQKIVALRLAKRHIKADLDAFICHALDYCPDIKTAKYLREYLSNQLAPHGSLEGWFFANYRGPAIKSVKEARLQWIDWMIANAT